MNEPAERNPEWIDEIFSLKQRIRELEQSESELKQVEAELRESEGKYRNILENIEEGYFEVDRAGDFTYFNTSLCRILGYTREEMSGMNYKVLTDSENVKNVSRAFKKIYVTGVPSKGFEWEAIRKDGAKRRVEVSVSLIAEPGEKPTRFRGIARDTTERKEAEGKLNQSEEKYRNILESIEDGYFEVDIAGNLTFFNDSVCRMLGYSRAELMGMNNRQYTDKENGQKLFQEFNKVFRTGDPSKGVGHEIIKKDGTKLYIESSASLIRNTSGQPIGFRGIMRNITERKRAEEKLQDTLDSLRKSISTTIQVMVSTVEARDPYTAGHQRRSANLARAIATEIGLLQDKIDAIRMAGSIHDIGKISIPAEILSKPTKLSEIEFSLIKAHAQRGFEMLKDIESPWPLAEIVYQHHERMDGSGYPRNLKGDEICIEARILSVADVVEAMASHRPYRPGLGINAALEEIEKNRGIFYDSAVADACLRLFREKGFQLAEA